jgi:hypothetical protein
MLRLSRPRATNRTPRRAVHAAIVAVATVCAACDDDRPPMPTAAASTARAAPAMRFEECAERAGLTFRMNFLPAEQGENFKINLYDHGCGVAIADFDGDGKDDVFFCNQLGLCGLYRNMGNLTFEKVTGKSGGLAAALEGKICVAAAFADVDGDGDEDLYVTTTRGGNVFLENLGGGKFRDATADAGLTLVAESEMPCFFDADGDGDLDLLVTNTAHWTLDRFDAAQRYYPGKSSLAELIASDGESNVFYRNDGKGHFTDATAEAGLASKGWGGDIAVFDMDGDGDLDLYVGNMFGGSALYRNDGKGHFTDVTREVLGRVSWGAVGARPFDYDGDGKLDLFIVDMHSDMWTPPAMDSVFVDEQRKYATFMERAVALKLVPADADATFTRAAAIRADEVVFGNTLYRNLGGGKFEETSDRAGAETFWPWGIAEGDFDSDGWTDAYIPSGMGYPFFYWRSPLLRNRGDGTFTDVCRTAGTEPPPGGPETGQVFRGRPAIRSSRSAATGDFDGDGRLDLVVSNFNDRAFLFHNVTAERHWCELRLAGAKGNRDAIGALVTLTAGGRKQVRQVQAAGGYLAQSSNTLHFGLGDAATIDRVEVRWPDGRVQTLGPVAIDALTHVAQPTE